MADDIPYTPPTPASPETLAPGSPSASSPETLAPSDPPLSPSGSPDAIGPVAISAPDTPDAIAPASLTAVSPETLEPQPVSAGPPLNSDGSIAARVTMLVGSELELVTANPPIEEGELCLVIDGDGVKRLATGTGTGAIRRVRQKLYSQGTLGLKVIDDVPNEFKTGSGSALGSQLLVPSALDLQDYFESAREVYFSDVVGYAGGSTEELRLGPNTAVFESPDLDLSLTGGGPITFEYYMVFDGNNNGNNNGALLHLDLNSKKYTNVQISRFPNLVSVDIRNCTFDAFYTTSSMGAVSRILTGNTTIRATVQTSYSYYFTMSLQNTNLDEAAVVEMLTGLNVAVGVPPIIQLQNTPAAMAGLSQSTIDLATAKNVTLQLV